MKHIPFITCLLSIFISSHCFGDELVWDGIANSKTYQEWLDTNNIRRPENLTGSRLGLSLSDRGIYMDTYKPYVEWLVFEKVDDKQRNTIIRQCPLMLSRNEGRYWIAAQIILDRNYETFRRADPDGELFASDKGRRKLIRLAKKLVRDLIDD